MAQICHNKQASNLIVRKRWGIIVEASGYGIPRMVSP